ncbi:hypothetical protein MACJ_000920 [Theileria orientalis]|uniref:RNA helicase n=1 Tax=Theileria orientalis TaxID=68886 RepID=A0A976M4X3_THEOR|nr:hypothetical protein MACJ_000920 [Theileria orientalis]
MNKLNSLEENYCKYDHTSDYNISLVVGGTNSGKTSSYLLALSDVVNDPVNEASMVNRDNYRSKMMVYGNLKGYKSFSLTGVKKINGIPKFNWNSYIVPAAVILVPFRELGMNIHNFCSKINIRSSLLAGGKGYKIQSSGFTSLNFDNAGSGSNGNLGHNCRGNVDVVIATPEMFYRSLNGRLDGVKIDIKFIKLLVFEEADLLNEEEYLEKINDIINLIYSNGLNLLYVSRFKTSAMMNNLEQMVLLNNNSSESSTTSSARNEFNVIETHVDNLDDAKKIFIHTSNSDRLELLVDLLHELNLPNSGNMPSNVVSLTQKGVNHATMAPHIKINTNIISNSKSGNKTVIYCKNHKCNIFLKYSLLDRGFNAINLFGGMYYDERTNNLKAFQTGSSILITTNFTARYKFDCNINQVILFDFPKDLNDYIHCISSLSGKEKKVYTFFNNKNLSLVKEIQAHSKSISKFEFRNLTPKLSRKLHLHQSLILKQLKTRGVKVPRKGSKLMAKRGFKKLKLRHLLKRMLVVTDHISAILILAKIYDSMKNNNITPSFIYAAVFISLIIFVIIMFLSNAQRQEYVRNFRMIFIIYFTLELFQGVLRTLISSFSDDTVYALALFIAVVHVLTQSYDLTTVGHEYMRDEDVIPMNCMILTSIVLASRLEDSMMASGFIQFSILFLSLLPRIKQYIQDKPVLSYGFTAIISATTCLTLKSVYIMIYLLGICTISVFFPLLYIYFQGFKSEMEITFPNNRFCDLTLNVLETERDSTPDQAIIKYNKVDNVLNVAISAVSVRSLRQKVNAFYESCYLVVSMLEQFLDEENKPPDNSTLSSQ